MRTVFGRSLLWVALALLAPMSTSAQVPGVFEPLPANRADARTASSLAQRADLPVTSRELVGMRLDRVFGDGTGASVITLNLPDRTVTADRQRVDAIANGFRTWVGRVTGEPDSHVVIAERDGVVSALVESAAGVYQVRTVSPGTYALEGVAASRFGEELPPVTPPVPTGRQAARASTPSAPADTSGTIDILLLYTPAMRTAAGGAAQVAALLAQIVSDTNTAYQQSGVPTRVRLAGSAELPYTESSAGLGVDLGALASSQAAEAKRDEVGADLVQLLVHSPGVSSACGVGYLMGSGLFGQVFAPYAYSVADWRCASQYTPTHEMGHNMGSHHAPEDGASGALFSYSYGYKSPVSAFRTVMAYNCSPSCPRVLRFSNPSLSYLGGVTGTLTQNNATSLAQAAYTVANFRQAVTPAPAPGPGGNVPSAPTGLQALVSGSTVTLSWNAVTADIGSAAMPDAATSYRLAVGTSAGASDLFNQNVGNFTAVSGRVGTGSYAWRVYAVNSAGESPASVEAQFTVVSPGGCTAPPAAPQAFTFSRSGSLVTLQWAAPASGDPATSYSVEAGSAPGFADLYNQPVGGVLGVSVQAPAGTYFVRIRSANACGSGPASSEQIIVVP
ncbi:MAG: reprolysin-like metallopeptidase [Vicinamibacterales bacterium]